MIAQAPEKLTVEVTTIYALSMAKFVYLQLWAKDGAQAAPPIRIHADTLENSGGTITLKLANQKVGEFNSGAVAGWWIQDEA